MFKKFILLIFMIVLFHFFGSMKPDTVLATGEEISFVNSLSSYGCNSYDTNGSFTVNGVIPGVTYDMTWLATVNGNAYENVIQPFISYIPSDTRRWNLVSVDSNGPIASWPIPTGEVITYTVALYESGNLLSQDNICIDSCDLGNIIACPSPTLQVEINSCPHFHDGRINNCDDAGWMVIYPHTDDTGIGFVITDTRGVNLLVVTPDQIATVPVCPDNNTLIASDNGVDVYRLAGSCGYEVVGPAADGKKYHVLFDTLYADTGYTSFEE